MTAEFYEIGDNVRIVSTELTAALGHADRVGVFYGFTTPSITGVDIVGEPSDDLAFNVGFDDDTDVWFSPELIELVDHAPGIRASVGDQEFVKGEDGRWVPLAPDRKQSRLRRWFGRA